MESKTDKKTKEYIVVFDTNILYQKYDQKADFLNFAFNSTYDNVISLVSQLDIYEKVKIAIPTVVWNEMEKQIIDAHRRKLIDFEKYIEKWLFPEYTLSKNDIGNYQEYIKSKILSYKKQLETGLCEVLSLPIPNKNKFGRIVERAFAKEPPFGGKEKNSDKGFKDVLIWESILELCETYDFANILFYTDDKGFKEQLYVEFKAMYPNAQLNICSKEDEIKTLLEEWARSIDQFSYIPVEESKDYPELEKWLESSDCKNQLIDPKWGLYDQSQIIVSVVLDVLSYDNIELIENTETGEIYSLDAVIRVEYKLKNETSFEDNKEVHMVVNNIDNTAFSVEDAYFDDEES